MQPNNPNLVPSDNPYAFIVNEAPKSPKRNLLGNQTSFKQRILLVVGGGFILIIVIVIVSSLFSSKSTTPQLLTLAADQQIMINVSTASSSVLVQQITKNLSANIDLSIESSQLNLIKYLASVGKTITVTGLTTPSSMQESKQITSAPANSVDNLYIQLVTNNLNNYIALTKQTYSATSSKSEKALLSQLYASATLLLKQLNTASTNP